MNRAQLEMKIDKLLPYNNRETKEYEGVKKCDCVGGHPLQWHHVTYKTKHGVTFLVNKRIWLQCPLQLSLL